jgi:hypothetical protein
MARPIASRSARPALFGKRDIPAFTKLSCETKRRLAAKLDGIYRETGVRVTESEYFALLAENDLFGRHEVERIQLTLVRAVLRKADE